MKAFLPILSTLVLLAELVTAQVKKVTAKRPPNIIYIYADDLGYGETGPYGQQKIKTPNIDRLAREGMVFTQHYTSAPVCAPARCMLMTGKHSGHSYIRGNYELGGFADSLEGGQMPLPEGTYTLPKMLKKAGYICGLAGKWGLGVANTTGSPLKQGFDYYFGYLDQKQAHNFYPSHLWENDKVYKLANPYIDVHRKLDTNNVRDEDFEYYKGKQYAPDLITAKANDFIRSNQKAPFFLYVPYTIPHAALQVPDAYVNKYKGKFAEKPYLGQRGYAAVKYPFSTYAGMISYLDDQVGLILEQVRRLGLDENTIIMFSSDNGTTYAAGVDNKFFNSVDGLRGLKSDVFEGGIREPFIARWPGKIRAGARTDLVSVQFDLMATLGELTGQDPGNTDGVSFLPTLLGKNEKQQAHQYLYFEYPEKGGQIAVRMGDWKGVRLDLANNSNSPWMLFNLKTDRNETSDVAAQHPEITARLSEIVRKEHQPAHVKEWEFIEPKFESRK
ncbi:arylsulfatase [Desertivirga arenae]|uniref:arylsulfatase n=1 Tax=Desertivirga arenae TaxID=2810309 RepID=UPI001A95A70C|nr:arylsulfatase [Pedobacter sp. SYSU D00823]